MSGTGYNSPSNDSSSSDTAVNTDTSPPRDENNASGDPVTSPARSEYESPVPSPSEPPSSNRGYSSPLRSSPLQSPIASSSSCDSPCYKRRKVYEFSEPEVPYDESYWPPSLLPPVTPCVVTGTATNDETIDEAPGGDLTQQIDQRDLATSLACDDLVHELEDLHTRRNIQESRSDFIDIPPESCDAELTSLLSTWVDDNTQSIPVSGVTVEDNSSSALRDEDDCSSSSSSSSDETDISDSSDSDSSGASHSSSSDLEESEGDFNFGALRIYEGSELSVDEGVYLIMDLFMSQKLTKTALECILKVVLKFIPEPNFMPRTMHMLFKYVENICPPVPPIIHFYCKTCLMYIGTTEKLCPLCSDSCKKFYQLPLASQIKNFFENLHLGDSIDKYAAERMARQCDGKYFDLCDGSEFQRTQLPGKYSLSLLGHTDGIRISESSNVSLWPLEFVLADVEPKLRFKFVLIAGIWVDTSKPNMHCFLKPFAEEMQELAHSGVKWIHPKTKSQEVSLVVSPCFCGDAPVRAELQGILSVGGKHCCNCCEQKMLKLPPGPSSPWGEKDQ